MIETQFYLLANKTHLHVGSGDSNYGVIDKLVQRDPCDDLPCIYASSLKGAFREYFEKGLGEDKKVIEEIFGASSDNGATATKGSHIFHDAFLLGIPVRSNFKPYYTATAPMALKKILHFSTIYDYSIQKSLKDEIALLIADNFAQKDVAIIFEEVTGIRIEDYDGAKIKMKSVKIPSLNKILGDNIVLFHDDDFKSICSDYNLPVIARNRLENGESTNLWYEQIIPRESRFLFPVNYYNVRSEQTPDLFKDKTNGKHVQIGANASVGYGVCLASADF